jgi:hypothetical protein
VSKATRGGCRGDPNESRSLSSYDEGDNDKEVGDSDEELVAAAECDFKRQARKPANHFEKLLKATCPNRAYPIRHKLKEYTMMKNYMTIGLSAGARSPKVTRWGGQPPLSPKKRWSCQFMVGLPPPP